MLFVRFSLPLQLLQYDFFGIGYDSKFWTTIPNSWNHNLDQGWGLVIMCGSHRLSQDRTSGDSANGSKDANQAVERRCLMGFREYKYGQFTCMLVDAPPGMFLDAAGT
jgi:hypothetical protein